MVNTELLREKINESGYKLQFVAKQIGITPVALWNKLNNETEFKVSEVKKLSGLLNLSLTDVDHIFFATQVD